MSALASWTVQETFTLQYVQKRKIDTCSCIFLASLSCTCMKSSSCSLACARMSCQNTHTRFRFFSPTACKTTRRNRNTHNERDALASTGDDLCTHLRTTCLLAYIRHARNNNVDALSLQKLPPWWGFQPKNANRPCILAQVVCHTLLYPTPPPCVHHFTNRRSTCTLPCHVPCRSSLARGSFQSTPATTSTC